jgi:glutamine synthetase
MDPGLMNHDNLYEVSERELLERNIGTLPGTLAEALDALDHDTVVQAALGEAYAKEYSRIKRNEWWGRAQRFSMGEGSLSSRLLNKMASS